MIKIARKAIAVLLAVTALILAVLPPAKMEAATTQGDFEMNGSTLVKYLGTATEVTLPDFVKEIGKDAFSNHETITNVTIPDSVKSIGYAAFENCPNLKSVSIPESVKTIGSSAFSGCEKLESVNIPKKTEEIGSGAFAKCSSLSTINVSPENTNFIMFDGVLYSFDRKTLVQYLAGRPMSSYAMPESIEKINEYAFWGANLLTAVSISNHVTVIPEYAFDNCNSLTAVNIPGSVRALNAYSFGNCHNLLSVKIPDSVGYIDELAFALSDRVNLENEEGEAVDTEDRNDTSVIYDEEITEPASAETAEPMETAETAEPAEIINQYVDYQDNKLPGEYGSTKIVGNSAMMLIPPQMPVKGFSIAGAEIEDDLSVIGSSTTFRGNDYQLVNGVLGGYHGNDEMLTLPQGITEIGNRAFYKNTGIRQVALYDGITTIGDFAFARSGIESLMIPQTVQKIGYAAFYHAENLNNLMIPETVETIELGALEGSGFLKNWMETEDGNNYLIVGDGILVGYKGEGGNIAIPADVKTIGAGCFMGNQTITGVIIPENVMKIGEDAFNSCVNLKQVKLSDGLEVIEDRAFKNSGIEEVRIPATVKNIGIGAFDTTGNGNTMERVVFLGSVLPDVSYKPTAERLSAQDLRTLCFEGTATAIVPTGCNIASGNIFDEYEEGFRGHIYEITKAASTDADGELRLLKSNALPDETSGEVVIDPHVMLAGKNYIMSSVDDDAFLPYKDCGVWSGRDLTGVSIDGNTSEELVSLLSMIAPSTASPTENDEESAIHIQFSHDGFLRENQAAASARMPGNTKAYTINIANDVTDKYILNTAFYSYYGEVADIVMVPMSITMVDEETNIPVKKLATGKLEMTLPVPNRFIGTDHIKVGAINDNGMLEELATQQTSVGGVSCIQFVASHFSTYVVYRVNENGEITTIENADYELETILTEEALMPVQIDGVIQTLHKSVNGIKVKWIIIAILLCCSAILYLWKDNRKSLHFK